MRLSVLIDGEQWHVLYWKYNKSMDMEKRGRFMKADRVFLNGKIYIVNDNRDWAQAVAVKGGKIVFVGTDEAAKDYIGDDTEVTDLDGKMMLPGFMDGHCHPFLAACIKSGIYFDMEDGVETVLEKIREYIASKPENDTYIGLGYAEWIFDEKGPKKELLDEICDDKPVLMIGSGGHEGWANSKALEMAGITKDTPDPIPGFQYYGRDAEGNPSGHLMETKPLLSVMSKMEFFKEETIKRLLEENSKAYAAMGITSVADMGIYRYLEPKSIEIYKEMTDNGKFLQRITAAGSTIEIDEGVEEYIDRLAELNKVYDSDRHRMNFLKIVNDGTLESRSAAMCDPYCEDGSMVETMILSDRLFEIFKKAADNGLDVQIHALGDASAKETLKATKLMREAGYDDFRIVNSHTQVVKPEDLPLFGKYDVMANTTNVWHYGNPDMIPIIGDRADKTFMLRSIIDGGAMMVLGSDFPVDEYGPEPLKSIEMGVTRKLYDDPDCPVLKPESEKLTIDDSIAGFTRNVAYQVRMEDKLGIIEPGKYADLVILEKNIFDVPVEDIHNVKVCETLLEGETVYKA